MSEGNDQHRLCTRGSAVAGICASWAGWIAATIRALTFRSPQSGTELMRDGGDSGTPVVAFVFKIYFSLVIFFYVLHFQEALTHSVW